MPDAVILVDDRSLAAPTVGTWRPAISAGGSLRGGVLLGHLRRVGRDVPITVPDGVLGSAQLRADAGQWMAYGEALIGVGAAGAEAEEPMLGEAGGAGDLPVGVKAVCAETEGTVYLSPEPGQPQFVVEGQEVQPRATVALVEVMKTFTQVRTEVGGQVERVLVQDGQSIEVGQALVWVRQSTES